MANLIKDPTELHETPDHIDQIYSALGKSTEYWAIIGRGAFVFRFGPYTGPEVGRIMERCVAERIAVTIVGQCGREFDWQAARDLGMRLVLPADRKGPLGWLARWRATKLKSETGQP